MTFDEMAATRPAPLVVTGFVCSEDAPLTYLFAGAIAADSEKQVLARDWYLRRIEQRVADTTR